MSENADLTDVERVDPAVWHDHVRRETTSVTRLINEQAAVIRALVDLFPCFVWHKDARGRYVAASRYFNDYMHGLGHEEVIGCTDADLFPDETAAQFEKVDEAVRTSGEAQVSSDALPTPEDGVRLLETRKAPVMLDGEVIGTVGFSRTAREDASPTIDGDDVVDYSRLVSALPFSLVRYDTDLRRRFINSHYRRSVGQRADELIGKRPTQMWLGERYDITAEQFEEYLRSVITSAEPRALEIVQFNPEQLRFAQLIPEFDANGVVTGVLMLSQEVCDASQYRAKLAHITKHDALTGLVNRTVFHERLTRVLDDTVQGAASGAVFVLDLDRFKNLNDSLGHHAGDDLLRQVTERLRSRTRPDDTVARLGGDEFAVLAVGLESDEEATRIAERLAESFQDTFTIDGKEIAATCSVGVSVFPDDLEDPNTTEFMHQELVDNTPATSVMRFAEAAMYEAKRHGGDNIQRFLGALDASLAERMQIEQDLRRAMDADELRLAFQPIYCLRTRRLTGTEALLRWTSPTLGDVPPSAFIPVAEDTGLITRLGAWVFDRACQASNAINAGRQIPLPVSVNVSARQFLRGDLSRMMRGGLAWWGCQPDWIRVEITESVLMGDDDTSRETLSALSQMGVRLDIDDFGVGYSSLSYLAAFPSASVKIDRSFVRDIADDSQAAGLVQAIVRLAGALHKEVVAEGVETPQQARLLTEWGCDRAQGYYFGRPMPLEDLLETIAENDSQFITD